ncbi:MAG: hypothetical protein U5N85_08810 [Arcicella sp.]|nr:hypothetical protein [Arcicella sp.]
MEALYTDSQSLLRNAAQMPITELERFLREANALLFRKKIKDTKLRERQLLYKINRSVLGISQIERYHLLSEQVQMGTIDEAERSEFEILANQEEKLRNLRVKYMIELSQIREVSLSQVMQSLGLNPLARA